MATVSQKKSVELFLDIGHLGEEIRTFDSSPTAKSHYLKVQVPGPTCSKH